MYSLCQCLFVKESEERRLALEKSEAELRQLREALAREEQERSRVHWG
jgi:hypothetical protein